MFGRPALTHAGGGAVQLDLPRGVRLHDGAGHRNGVRTDVALGGLGAGLEGEGGLALTAGTNRLTAALCSTPHTCL